MKEVFGKSQNKFTRGKSCLIKIITFYNEVTFSVHVRSMVDFV